MPPTETRDPAIHRRTLLAAAGLAALAGPALALAARREPEPTYFEWSEPRAGIFVAIGGGGNSMAWRAEGEHAILIDTKNGGLGEIIAAEATERAGGRIATVINTHHHADHVGGNIALTSRCRVIAHERAEARVLDMNRTLRERVFENTDAILTDDQRPERIRQWARDAQRRLALADATDFAPNTPVRPDPVLTLDGLLETSVELHHFGPGHTDTDLLVRLPDRNVIHAGDLIFNGLHPFFDPPGGATVRGWLGSLERLDALCDADTLVVPGHGPVGDRSTVRAQHDYLTALIEAVEQEITAGTSLEDATTKSWPFMEGLGFEQVRPRAIAAVYAELAAERE